MVFDSNPILARMRASFGVVQKNHDDSESEDNEQKQEMRMEKLAKLSAQL